MKKRAFYLLLSILLLFAAFGNCETIPTAKERSQQVKVLLTRLKLTDQADFTLASPYLAETGLGGRIYLQEGSQITVCIRNEKLVLTSGTLSIAAGKKISLQQAGKGSTETGFRQTNFSALYQGDLTLTIEESKIQPVLTINVEDYLLGVVPYEMSDTFPLEALKAQAVAARTYALAHQGSRENYDVSDTTSDQVFRGYISGYDNAEKAVAETQGVCAFYKGKLATCYYAASNGGQTETVAHAWPKKENLPYYQTSLDPYDVENPASRVQSYVLQKTYQEEAPYALRCLISELLMDELTSFGFSAAPDDIALNEVLSVTVDTPNRKGSILMTKLHIQVKISTPWINPLTKEQSSPIQIPKVFTLDIDIFPTAESYFEMNLSGNYENEIWSCTEQKDSFVLEARRYGHGVGMSQRGAQWMAYKYGKTYQEILDFYYPGITLKAYPAEEKTYATDTDGLSENLAPAASPTPKPTLMPVSSTPAPNQAIAEVTEIASDSSLNVRTSPSLNAEILTRIYKGQKLIIVEYCEEDGWVKIRTDSLEGYVMEKYLTIEK